MAQLEPNARLLGRLESECEFEPRERQLSSPATRVAELHAKYNTQTGVYQTTSNLSEVNPCSRIGEANNDQNDETIGQLNLRSTSSALTLTCNILERYTEPLSSYVFYANLFMSIMNTFLLSFLVKSLQLSEHNSPLGDGRLVWDEHSESMTLNWPVSLRGDRSLHVGSIESHRDEPLILTSMVNLFEALPTTNDDANDDEANLRGVSDEGQILIKAQSTSAESNISNDTNYILLKPPPTAQNTRHGKRQHQRQQLVEIVANSLIINQLVDIDRAQQLISMSPSQEHESGHAYKRYSSRQSGVHSTGLGVRRDGNQLKRQSGATNGVQIHASIGARRLLELDGRRQAIALPFMNKIDLFPSSATTLFIKGQLRSQSGINGRLKENFDLQARWGNLSFESGRTLRIVSKSDKLDLASAQILSLEAPTLKLSATKTNKVLLSAGIKFFSSDWKTPADIIKHDADAAAVPLAAFKLVLIDDILMASRD